MSLLFKDKNDYSKVLTESNWTDLIFSKSVKMIDQNTDLNDLTQGIYQVWGGSNPQDAPKEILPWSRYYVVPFWNHDTAAMFAVAVDTNGNIFVRVKSGNSPSWQPWHKLAFGGGTSLLSKVTSMRMEVA